MEAGIHGLENFGTQGTKTSLQPLLSLYNLTLLCMTMKMIVTGVERWVEQL